MLRQNTARFLWLLFAALQLGLPGAASLADARLEAAASAGPHVESRSSPSCPPGHPAGCLLCQFLQTPAVRAGGFVPPPPRLPESALAAPEPQLRAGAARLATPFARGPPLAS